MQRKNTLKLSWGDVKATLFLALQNNDVFEVEQASEIEISYDACGLTLIWTAPEKVRPQLQSEEQIISQPPCALFNEACAPVLDMMGLDGIPVHWLEHFLFSMSFVVRAQDRNGQIYMPEKFGHGVVGPYMRFAQFHQYILTCLGDRWPVTDTSAREAHNCIAALALWVGANTFPMFGVFKDEFLSSIQTLLETPCE